MRYVRYIVRLLGTVTLLTLVAGLTAQDRAWIATWEAAQRERPKVMTSVARIASRAEAGTPLVIRGRIYNTDGRSPASGLVIFAYQTDSKGLYNHDGAPGWRLRGWARSDAKGRFEFHTIRPASYPGTRTPAHVHFTIEGPGVPRHWTPELNFADDPFVTARARQTSGGAGIFGSVRPVSTRGGVQYVDWNLRVTNEGRF